MPTWPPRIQQRQRWPPAPYRIQGLERGASPALIERALAQAHLLQKQNLPAILTLNHLAERLEVSYEFLRGVVARKIDAYRVFSLKKRAGGYREICIPEVRLLKVQQWLHSNILVHIKPHDASYAYARGSSVLECARQHCQSRWLIKLDITSFFESISELQVYRIFRGLGYGALVSFEFARLCTRQSFGLRRLRYRRSEWRVHGYGYRNRRYLIARYRQRRIGHLIQGAPTSPLLSNLAVVELDERLSQIAARERMTYSRYSDDLVFSTSRKDFSRKIAASIVGEVYRELAVRGFDPQRNKAVISPPGSRKVVLGLLVDGAVPRLPREFKERLRQHLYYLEKHGVTDHAQKQGFSSIFSMRRHLEGLARYARYVEEPFGEKIMSRLAAVDWPPLPSGE